MSATTPISHSDDADLLAPPRGLRLLFWPLLVVYNRFLCSLVVSPSQVSLYLSPVLLLPLPPAYLLPLLPQVPHLAFPIITYTYAFPTFLFDTLQPMPSAIPTPAPPYPSFRFFSIIYCFSFPLTPIPCLPVSNYILFKSSLPYT